MRFGSVPVWSLPFSSLGLYSCSKLWIKITGCGAKNGLQIECWTWLQSYLIWINIYLNVQNIRFKACTQNVCSSHRGRMKKERRHVQRAHLWLNIMLMVYIIWFVSSACEAQWNRHGWDARTPARYAKDAIQTDWNTLGFNMEENYLFNELMRIYEWENVLPSVTATTHHSIIHFAISNKYFRFSSTSLLNITLPALKSRTLPVVCFFFWCAICAHLNTDARLFVWKRKIWDICCSSTECARHRLNIIMIVTPVRWGCTGCGWFNAMQMIVHLNSQH